MEFNTKVIHGGQELDPGARAISVPIYQTSTYALSAPGEHGGYEYSRSANPTRSALEKALASIEDGNYGLVFASGMASIDAVLKLLKPGDEVIVSRDLYGGSYRLFSTIYKDFGLHFRFINLQKTDLIEKEINSNTKLLWIETPTNPTLAIIDIEKCAEISRRNNLLLAVDNTFATPYLQRPLELGADIVMHSATKYLGGHSDLVLGALVVRDQKLAEKLYFIQNSCGAVGGPMDCFLVLRGIKTLSVRMERHCKNARSVAKYLATHPKVEKVFWPGFDHHFNHDIASEQMKEFGAMVSFTLKQDSRQDAIKVLKSLKIFTLAESLGGVESLCGHPATMSHASIPKEMREKSGITDSMIRLSPGIESENDLIEDLKAALQLI